MINLLNSNPAFIFYLAAAILPFLKGQLKNIFAIIILFISFIFVYQLEPGIVTFPFLHYELTILRVDVLSKAFGYIFTLSCLAAFIYGYFQKKSFELVSILIYVGSAIGVIFSGDLLSLYMFWELMAVFSTFLILSNKTVKSMLAAKRYILIHVAGGLVLLAGIMLHINSTGSIAFNSFTIESMSTWLILIGFLVNAAAFPFNSWLTDAYPEATILGGVILSAYTSKTAIYALLRGFPGWDILVIIGCIMAIYGIIYGLLENDIRRVLAFSIINQLGFKICGIGIGTSLALSGVIAHSICSILYNSLLWMSAGGILYSVGKSKFTELGGLYRSMPLTCIFAIIGALSISSFPLTNGFTSKTIILLAAQNKELLLPWFILKIGSVGAFVIIGLKFIYFSFFNKQKELKVSNLPTGMYLGMGLLSILCIYIGCFPEVLYNILPNSDIVKETVPYTFYSIYVKKFVKVLSQFQILTFATIAFFLFLPFFKIKNKISIDIDIIYRRGAQYVFCFIDWFFNSLNKNSQKLIIDNFVNKVCVFCKHGPSYVLYGSNYVYLLATNNLDKLNREKIFNRSINNNFPVGNSALFILITFIIIMFLNNI
ncbi:Na(+)/H(+) antiporter subunit D [Candidatus Marinamargulisbacteria bacterium SCGC AG-410-N11]|nr:Na(+)/H(+) antiporter subunit D [Candidatus Marinamargulisbacteria bacterium SCGC AG-410-N11]